MSPSDRAVRVPAEASKRLWFRFYTPDDASRWNQWVARSPQATFLFDRGFMDYHAHRFTDASVLAWQGERLLAVLPAHREGDRLVSHGGLSYGGLVLAQPAGAEAMLALMRALQAWLCAQGIGELIYKTVPSIYHQLPCEDDRWALFCLGAELVRRDALSVIGPRPDQWPRARRRQITQAMRERHPLAQVEHAGCSAESEADWQAFWALLTAELAARHQSRPVHSLAEIGQLARRFPHQIGLHLARRAGEAVAGLVVFDTPTVRHVQYMAASPEARRSAALDRLAETAIAQAQAEGRWFDFGHSNEQQGRALNAGLAFYKESHGASTVVHDTYRLACQPSPAAA